MPARLGDGDRETALRVGYAATDWTRPISYDDYERFSSDWIVRPIVNDDKCIGAAYFKDGEVHVSILPEWRKRWVNRKLLNDLLGAPDAMTRVTPGHEFMYGILYRLGFVLREDGMMVKGY